MSLLHMSLYDLPPPVQFLAHIPCSFKPASPAQTLYLSSPTLGENSSHLLPAFQEWAPGDRAAGRQNPRVLVDGFYS